MTANKTKEVKKKLKKKYGLSNDAAGLATLFVVLHKKSEPAAAAAAKKTVKQLDKLVKEAKKAKK